MGKENIPTKACLNLYVMKINIQCKYNISQVQENKQVEIPSRFYVGHSIKIQQKIIIAI